jgi:LemA protein
VQSLDVALLVAAVLLLGLFLTYNRFVRSRLRTLEAWSGIDVQLKRRTDLVPNLVETVKAYAGHERVTLEAVVQARAALQQAGGPAAAAEANAQLTRALTRLLALAEAYPALRAAESFLELQRELSDLEEKIAYARQFYNRNVLHHNTRIHTFPQMLVAGIFDFQPFEFFEAEDPARTPVPAKFEGS